VAVPPSAQASDAPRFHEFEQFLAQHAIVARGGAPFHLRDVPLGHHSGVVLLWRDGTEGAAPDPADAGAEFLLFVRHPRLRHYPYVRRALDLRMVRLGPDWALLSLYCPAQTHLPEDWCFDDPAGQPIEKVREIRKQIQERVERLLAELGAK
jgi:hypothetical protein